MQGPVTEDETAMCMSHIRFRSIQIPGFTLRTTTLCSWLASVRANVYVHFLLESSGLLGRAGWQWIAKAMVLKAVSEMRCDMNTLRLVWQSYCSETRCRAFNSSFGEISLGCMKSLLPGLYDITFLQTVGDSGGKVRQALYGTVETTTGGANRCSCLGVFKFTL